MSLDKIGIVLGAQIVSKYGRWIPSEHLKLRLLGATGAYRQGLVSHFIVTGGYNVGVRYNENSVFKKANFSFEALALAQVCPSESDVMRDFLCAEGEIPRENVYKESLSATTVENAMFVAQILKRIPAFSKVKKIFVITLLYHMQSAFNAFAETGIQGLIPMPAEDLLRGTEKQQEVLEYYRDRKKRTGAEFPVIADLKKHMEERESVLELLPVESKE